MKLAATGIPYAIIRKVAQQMKDRGIPIASPYLVRYAIGKAAGIPDDKLNDFVIARPGRKPGNGIEDILTDNEQVTP